MRARAPHKRVMARRGCARRDQCDRSNAAIGGMQIQIRGDAWNGRLLSGVISRQPEGRATTNEGHSTIMPAAGRAAEIGQASAQPRVVQSGAGGPNHDRIACPPPDLSVPKNNCRSCLEGLSCFNLESFRLLGASLTMQPHHSDREFPAVQIFPRFP